MIDYLRSNNANPSIVDYFGVSIDDLKNSRIRMQIFEDLHGYPETKTGDENKPKEDV